VQLRNLSLSANLSYPSATASKPQRASTNIVLAELGSLSVEFTRLAQLTTENKYYDAVARITDALELWQNNTRLPGLWPLQVDASGCEMPQYSYNEYQKHPALSRPDLPVRLTQQDAVGDDTPLNNLEPPTPQTKDSSSFGTDPVDVVEEKKNPVELYKEKDHSSWANDVGDDAGLTKRFPPIDPSALCKPVGLASHAVAEDKFTIGGMADSVYEYLPKVSHVSVQRLAELIRHRNGFSLAESTANISPCTRRS